MDASATVPVGVLSIPAEKKESSLRVLRRDFPRPDGSAVAIFAVLWNERDGGDCAALDRVLSRAIESGATLLRTEDGAAKKRFAPDHILEYIARTTNATIVREIDIGQLSRVPRVHAVLAACYRNEIALLGHGAVHAYLFREEKRKIIPTDLLHLDEKKDARGGRNFFGEFVSGTLRADDVVAFGANTLLDYLSLEHLGTLVSGTEHPEEATEKIAHLVSDTGGLVPFGEVLLRHPDARVPKREPKRPVQSINKLLNTQKETTQYLETSVFSFLRRFFEDKPKQKPDEGSTPETPAPIREKSPRSGGPGLFTRMTSALRRLPKPNQLSIRKIGAWWRPSDRVGTAHHKALNAFVTRFNTFPARAKIIFPLVLLGIVLFVQSVILVQGRVSRARVRREFESKITEIREKITAAQANLLYGNEEGAVSLIEEIKMLALNLTTTDASFQNEVQTVRGEAQKIAAQISHREIVTAKKIATVPEGGPLALASIKSETTVLDRRSGTVYIFKPGDALQTLSASLHLPATSGAWLGLLPANAKGMMALGDQDIASISLDEKIAHLVAADPRISLAGAAVWNKRLYRLGSDGKIYRHDAAGDGFTAGTPWLKDEPAAHPKGMEIDSVIYVLDEPNIIIKYLGGKKQSFTLPKLDEPLSGVTRIRTWADSDVLALLDPPTGRIIFVTSAGKLIKQYEDKATLTSATDFAIDPASHTIFVATPGAVSSFAFSLK